MFVVKDDILPLKGRGKHNHSHTSQNGFQHAPQPLKQIKQSGWSLRRVSDLWGMKQPNAGRLDAEITI
jgi:hypothetical protein